MAIVFVHSSAGGGTGTTVTQGTGMSTTTGHQVLVALNVSSSTAPTSVTDSASNSYTQIASLANSSAGVWLYLYGSFNITGNAANKIIATFPSSVSGGFVQAEYSGVSSTQDGSTVTGTGTASTALVAGSSISTTNASDIVVSIAGTNGAPTFTAGSGYTLRQALTFSPQAVIEDQITSATGSFNGPMTAASNVNWSLIAVALKATGPVSPSVSGTISVTCVLAPAITPIYEALSGNTTITAATPTVNLDYFVSLSGAISVSIAPPSSNPGGQPVTFNPVEPNLTGTSGLIGVTLSPTFLTPLIVSITGNTNVTGVIIPAASPSLTGIAAVSGVFTPTFTPIFPTVSGLISANGAINLAFGPVTTSSISIAGSSNAPVGPGINNLQLGLLLSGSISETGAINLSLDPGLGLTTSALISISGTVSPSLPTFIVSGSGTLSITGVINTAIDPGLGNANPGFMNVTGTVSPVLVGTTISVSGTVSVTGTVNLLLIIPSSTGSVNVTCAFAPGISQATPFTGTVAVSGSVIATITPIFVTLSGTILVSAVNDFDKRGKTIIGSLIGPYDFWGGGYG